MVQRAQGQGLSSCRATDLWFIACAVFWKQKAHENKANDPEGYEKTFKAACEDIPPVMNRIFLDLFPQPALYFAKRQVYVRSVAVSSMVCCLLAPFYVSSHS
jgi:phosphatidylinositol kinase/protein kinase (PI-3  family)